MVVRAYNPNMFSLVKINYQINNYKLQLNFKQKLEPRALLKVVKKFDLINEFNKNDSLARFSCFTNTCARLGNLQT